MTVNQAFAAAAAALAVLALLAGTPASMRNATATGEAREEAAENEVSPVALAEWLRGQKAGLRIIDLRSAAEYEQFRLPRAEHFSPQDITAAAPRDGDVIVLYATDPADAKRAQTTLRAMRSGEVLLLRGGVEAWLDEVMSPPASAAAKILELSRYFGGRPRPAADSVVPLETRVRRLQRRGC